MCCLDRTLTEQQQSQHQSNISQSLFKLIETRTFGEIEPLMKSAQPSTRNKGSFFANIIFNPTTVLEPTKENLKLFSLQGDVGWPDHWKDVVGRSSLAMANGAVHKKMRSVGGRAFTAETLDGYLPRFQKSTKALAFRGACFFLCFHLGPEPSLLGLDPSQMLSRVK